MKSYEVGVLSYKQRDTSWNPNLCVCLNNEGFPAVDRRENDHKSVRFTVEPLEWLKHFVNSESHAAFDIYDSIIWNSCQIQKQAVPLKVQGHLFIYFQAQSRVINIAVYVSVLAEWLIFNRSPLTTCKLVIKNILYTLTLSFKAALHFFFWPLGAAKQALKTWHINPIKS